MKKNNFFIISALLAVCFFSGLASVSAAFSDIYVSPNGNDTSNNGTVDSPYQSIGKGVNQSNDSSNVNIYLPGSVNLTIAGAEMNKTILYDDSVNWAFFNNW